MNIKFVKLRKHQFFFCHIDKCSCNVCLRLHFTSQRLTRSWLKAEKEDGNKDNLHSTEVKFKSIKFIKALERRRVKFIGQLKSHKFLTNIIASKRGRGSPRHHRIQIGK